MGILSTPFLALSATFSDGGEGGKGMDRERGIRNSLQLGPKGYMLSNIWCPIFLGGGVAGRRTSAAFTRTESIIDNKHLTNSMLSIDLLIQTVFFLQIP